MVENHKVFFSVLFTFFKYWILNSVSAASALHLQDALASANSFFQHIRIQISGGRKNMWYLSTWGKSPGNITGFMIEAATASAASPACEFTGTFRPESSKYQHCYIQVLGTIYSCQGRNVASWKNHTGCCIWSVLVLVLHKSLQDWGLLFSQCKINL